MRLLMLSGDRALSAGRRGPFHSMLESFRHHWERIDVVSPRPPAMASVRPFPEVQLHPHDGGGTYYAFARRVGEELCRARRPDLIVSHDYGVFTHARVAARLRRRHRVPWVSEIHHVDGFPRAASPVDRLRRVATRVAVGRAAPAVSAFRVVSRQVRDLLANWGVDAEKLRLLGSLYLDLETFAPGPESDPAGADLLFCGRLAPEKGPLLFASAVEALHRRRPDLRVTVVGSGRLHGIVERRLRRCLGDGRATFLDWVGESSELAALYRSSKALVCTSFAEGNPRVVAEALACGTPVVSTRVGRAVELVEDGMTGRLVGWDPEEIAAACLEVLDNATLAARCRDAGPAAVADCERERAIATLAGAYREIAAGGRAG